MVKKYILTLVIIGLAVYSFSLFNQFLWDDESLLTNSQQQKNLKNIPQYFIGRYWESGVVLQKSKSYYRPIGTTLYSLLFIFSGEKPFLFRLFQVSVHILNSIFLFYIFYYFFRSKRLSLFLSVVFLVHPGISEAVFFISSIQELVYFLFGLTALLLVITNKIKTKQLLVSLCLLFAGLLVKEAAVVFFTIIFLYLLLFNNKSAGRFLILSIVAVWIYLMGRLYIGSDYSFGQGAFPIMRVDLWQRIINIPAIIFYYLKKSIIPLNLSIAEQWVIVSPTIKNFFVPLVLLILFLLAIALWSIKTKDKKFVFFFGWFVLAILPYLQLIPLNMTVAERWLYSPIVGLLGMMGAIISRQNIYITKIKKIGICLTIFTVGIITVFAIRTFMRGFDWRSGLVLFSHDYQRGRSSFDIENNLGVELMRTGQYKQAKKHFKKSVELGPHWWVNWNNLGAAYEKEGRLDLAHDCYQRSISQGDYYLAYTNLAKILLKLKRNQEATQFLHDKALVKFPYSQELINLYRLTTNSL